MIRILFCLLMFFSSYQIASANCSATVHLKDWKGGFSSLESGFDWCFEVASSWGLDMSEGWKTRYCSSKTIYDNYGGVSGYDFLFFHLDRVYDYKYSRSFFYASDLDYSPRIHDGYSKRIEIFFSKGCGKDGSYDY